MYPKALPGGLPMSATPPPVVSLSGPESVRANRAAVAFLFLTAVMYAIEFWLARSVRVPDRMDILALAITADLTLLIPLLCYCMVVRPRHLKALTLVPVFVLSVLGATLVLPEDRRDYVHMLGGAVFLAEAAGLVYAILQIRNIVRAYRETNGDIEERLRTAMEAVFGRNIASAYLAAECSIPYFALFSWRRPVPRDPHLFSIHENNGYGGVVFGFSMLLLFEGIAVHFLAEHYAGPLIAWLLTATSIYTMLWLIADYGAMRLRPIRIETDALHLSLGLRWSITVPRTSIAEVRRITALPDTLPKDCLNLAQPGEPQFEIVLAEPVEARSLFGMGKSVSRLYVAVDDPARFAAVFEVEETTE
jgi:hypothetical protein